MICPKCHTPLDVPADFCPHCGAGLHRSGGHILIIAAGLVLVILALVYGYIDDRFFDRRDGLRKTAVAPSPQATSSTPTAASDKLSTKREPPPIAALASSTGQLILSDITGEELGTYTAALVSSGWFAFPSRLLIGARTWQVVLGDGRSFAVEGAILREGDPVGLWAAALNAPLDGLPLAPWDPQQPLRWHSLEETDTGRNVTVASFETLGNFDRIPVPDLNNAPGIFTQGDNLVGWSFGDGAPGGFLWTGSPGVELIPEFYTDDFYRLTFEGSREEAFLLALANPGLSDLQRLSALAEAHLLETRMPRDILPDRIAPPAIQQTMRHLVDNLRKQNRIDEMLTLFTPQILAAVNHPPLVADLATAAQQAGDYDDALDLLEMLALSTSGEAQKLMDYKGMQAAVYREWIDRLLAEGDVITARSVYEEATERFPQDPFIHLAGVELVLQNQNWELAERLLSSRSYPPDLRDRVSRLQRDIADLKSQEGKILIRFRPGSPTVPVTANLGNAMRQRFLVDTGASIVTVPSETAHRLGIDLSGSLPRRLFFSATGARNAIEVTLPSIIIDGWEVVDVKALVVDLPGQPGVGLLGMNYLNNFRMDLDTDNGLLTLAPR